MNDVIKEPLWQISVIKSPLPPRLSPFPHTQTSASFILTDYSCSLKGTPEHLPVLPTGNISPHMPMPRERTWLCCAVCPRWEEPPTFPSIPLPPHPHQDPQPVPVRASGAPSLSLAFLHSSPTPQTPPDLHPASPFHADLSFPVRWSSHTH